MPNIFFCFSCGKNPRQWVVQHIFGLIWLQLRTISPLFASWCYCYNGCLLQSSSFFSGQHCVVNRPPTSFFMWPLEVFKWRFKKGKWGLPSASLKNELPWHFFHHWPAYLLSIHAYLISTIMPTNVLKNCNEILVLLIGGKCHFFRIPRS